MPIAYNGRASSIVVSGTDIRRPIGQVPGGVWTETAKLDFEVEIAAIVGKSSDLGRPIKAENVHDHIFGYVILNDWTARDI